MGDASSNSSLRPPHCLIDMRLDPFPPLRVWLETFLHSSFKKLAAIFPHIILRSHLRSGERERTGASDRLCAETSQRGDRGIPQH